MKLNLPFKSMLLTSDDVDRYCTLANQAYLERGIVFEAYNKVLEACKTYGVNPSTPPIVNPIKYDLVKLSFALVDFGRPIRLHDNIHWGISLIELEEFLSYDRTNTLEYKQDIWDCDNYAYQLHNNAARNRFLIGLIKNSIHAWNIFIDINNYTVVQIEPQANAIVHGQNGLYILDKYTEIWL